jgi:hypothetical protein
MGSNKVVYFVFKCARGSCGACGLLWPFYIANLFYFGLCIVIFGYFDAFKYLFHLFRTSFPINSKKSASIFSIILWQSRHVDKVVKIEKKYKQLFAKVA